MDQIYAFATGKVMNVEVSLFCVLVNAAVGRAF